MNQITFQQCPRVRGSFGPSTSGCTAYLRPAAFSGQRSRASTSIRAENKGDIFEGIKRVAKKIQGALPIIGLVSRLATPGGGFDEQSYAEYARGVYDKGWQGFAAGQKELEASYGREGNSRWLLLLLWMTRSGAGLVPSKDIIGAARRLRVSQDMEVEIDRFEGSKGAMIKKYQYVSRPDPKPRELAIVAVDALATLAIGLKDGQPIPEKDKTAIRSIVAGVFASDGVTDELVDTIIAERASRAGTYA